MTKENNQLPHVAFSVLLALSLRERHGYEIIKQVTEDSGGRVRLGPGALYTSIKQLMARGMNVEVSQSHDAKRRYYKLSELGAQALSQQLSYYESALQLAKQRRALHHAKPSIQTT